MIGEWMLYSVAVSAVLGLCALSLEHGLRRSGTPLRWLWAGALLGSLVLGALPWLDSRRAASEPVVMAEAVMFEPEAGAPVSEALTVDIPPVWRAPHSSVGAIDRPLLVLWGIVSVAGMLYLVGTHRTLSRRRRMWRPATLDGVHTLVSRNVGPAVVGFLDSAIVVPVWVERMDAEGRRLVLVHEQEHLRAGDARLLSLALIALAIAPWNAPLWWQVRRLRHAVELDCDARVMDGDADEDRYCELLIEVGERASMRGVAFAAFAESSSFLERRIMSMVGPKPRRWRLAAGITVTLAGLFLLSAWSAPIPRLPRVEIVDYPVEVDAPMEFVTVGYVEEVAVAGFDTTVLMTEEVVEEGEVVVLPDEAYPEVLDIAEVVRRRHPDLYAGGLPLEQAIWFAVSREGRIVKSWVGPNLYLNFYPGYQPLKTEADQRAEAARAQSQAQELVLTHVPGMRVRGMYGAHMYTDPGVFAVHFFTEAAGQPSRVGGLDHATTAVGRAILAELGR